MTNPVVSNIVSFTDGTSDRVLKNPSKSEVSEGVVSFYWNDSSGRCVEVAIFPLHRIKEIATTIEYQD